jgi:hypothetical protein
MFGKMTQKPWCYKTDNQNVYNEVQGISECVSVDQMESHVPGLIAQLKGISTQEWYKVATIFVDHASDYTYVYLQSSSSSAQTLAAKKDFERHVPSVGVKVQRYHADNGRFVDNAWMCHLKEMNQTMSLCGVNAHHQNGKVEKQIQDLQDLARSLMLHTQNLWPDTITKNLWPYAIRKAANDLNNIKKKSEMSSPSKKFSKVHINIRSRDLHSFGCPMYVLQNTGSMKSPKWSTRARMAVYIGPSMTHASSVGLALSLQTGLVSPVFHAKYEDTLSTVRDLYGKYIT